MPFSNNNNGDNDNDDDNVNDNDSDNLQAFQLIVLARYLLGNMFSQRQMADWSVQAFPSI